MFGTLSANDYVRTRIVELDDQDDSSMLYASTTGANAVLTHNNNVYIGNNSGLAGSFDGQMAEMRIYNNDLNLYLTDGSGAWTAELADLRALYVTIPRRLKLNMLIGL